MPRFAANLSMMFTEVPFLDRFAAAPRAGLQAVEFLFPYELPAAEIAQRLATTGCRRRCSTARPATGRRASAALASLPGRQAEFRDGVKQALDYAEALGCKLVHCMAGIGPRRCRGDTPRAPMPRTWPGRREQATPPASSW